MADESIEFSWGRDFKNVNWVATLKYNGFRATGAGIVWCILSLLNGSGVQALPMLLFPVAYFTFLLPVGLIAGWLSGRGVPFIGLFCFFVALCVVVGDPIVFLLHKFKPGVVPVDSPRFFNFKIINFIIDDPETR